MATPIRYGIITSGLVPVRRDASDASEMITQCLLGETFRIQEETERWYHILADHDGYAGWISKSQARETDTADHLAWSLHPERKRSGFFTYRVSNSHETLLVPAGAQVITTSNGIELPSGNWDRITSRQPILEHSILDTALNFRGASYLWGGRSDNGIDCSGFVQSVYGLHGYPLPRDAWQQHAFAALDGTTLAEASAGDILYFSYGDNRIHHVGFYLGDGYLLHASGSVTIHTIDPAKRNSGRYLFNERLASTLVGFHTSKTLKSASTKKRAR